MNFKTLDWIGRTPLVLLHYIIVKITETPVSVPVMVTGLMLLAIQFGAIARCLYLMKSGVIK